MWDCKRKPHQDCKVAAVTAWLKYYVMKMVPTANADDVFADLAFVVIADHVTSLQTLQLDVAVGRGEKCYERVYLSRNEYTKEIKIA